MTPPESEGGRNSSPMECQLLNKIRIKGEIRYSLVSENPIEDTLGCIVSFQVQNHIIPFFDAMKGGRE